MLFAAAENRPSNLSLGKWIEAALAVRAMIEAEDAAQPIGPEHWPTDLRRALGRYAAIRELSLEQGEKP